MAGGRVVAAEGAHDGGDPRRGPEVLLRDVEAVKGISFDVAPGEYPRLPGPNGAGKSTTIKMLTGPAAPGAVTTEVLGFDVTAADPQMQARIGVCFEERTSTSTCPAGRTSSSSRACTDQGSDAPRGAAPRGPRPDRAKVRVRSYSKGMRQRHDDLPGLHQHPGRALILDEPTRRPRPVHLPPPSAPRSARRPDRGAAVCSPPTTCFEADELSDRVAFLNDARSWPWTRWRTSISATAPARSRCALRDGDGDHERSSPSTAPPPRPASQTWPRPRTCSPSTPRGLPGGHLSSQLTGRGSRDEPAGLPPRHHRGAAPQGASRVLPDLVYLALTISCWC
jgi:ABC-2 type transport system ATP-binding protein